MQLQDVLFQFFRHEAERLNYFSLFDKTTTQSQQLKLKILGKKHELVALLKSIIRFGVFKIAWKLKAGFQGF